MEYETAVIMDNGSLGVDEAVEVWIEFDFTIDTVIGDNGMLYRVVEGWSVAHATDCNGEKVNVTEAMLAGQAEDIENFILEHLS